MEIQQDGGGGHHALFVFIIILCYRKSAMQGHYICFHFINCHYSAIFILSEGLEGHGEWVATAAYEHPRCGSLPCSEDSGTGCGFASWSLYGGGGSTPYMWDD